MVCKQCVATYSEAWETAQFCVEVKADPTASRKGTYEATAQANIAAVGDPGDRAETLEALGEQATYVTKDMDPAASLDDAAAREAMFSEYRRLDAAVVDTAEVASLPENAIVVSW